MVSNLTYLWQPCKAGYFAPGRSGFKSILLHSGGGSRAGDIATLTGQSKSRVSAHWYICRDGSLLHFVQDADTAWHGGKVVAPRYRNVHSIGIEQEHRDQDHQDWPIAQVQAGANLCAALQQKHGMMEIVSHANAAAPPGRKVDPKNYPWETFRALLAAAQKTHWGFAVKSANS